MGESVGELREVEGKGTVIVRVGEATFEIARDAAAALGLHPGLPVDGALRERLEAAAGRRAAAAQVLRWLRGRPRTASEVRRYLGERGHTPAAVASVLGDLQRQGLVDDRRWAEWFVQARLVHRPAGVERLVQEMRAHGVPAELARAAAERGVGPDEMRLALAAASRRMAATRRLGPERGARRLAHFLARRGFSEECVRRVCLQVFGTAEPGGAAPFPEES